MQKENTSRKQFWVFVAILLIASALTYLPLANQIGYLNDDWYVMYDAHTQGSQFFHEVWRVDRPGRAFFMIPLFDVFGMNPFPYHISAYLFRFLGGASLFWTLQMLWPKRRFLPAAAAVLFTIYPGFLAQTNAIDYQSHILALFLALLSIALTVKAILASSNRMRILLTGASILLGWAYLSQMEYFIALEVFRLAVVFLLLWRTRGLALRQKLTKIFLRWLPFAAAPAGFLIWRLFFFEADRRATDVGFQLGQLFSSPLVGLWWLVYLVQDIFNVLLVAWGYPLYMLAYQMRLRDTLIGFGLAAFVAFLVVVGLRWRKEDAYETEAGSRPGWMREEYWLGLVTIIGGLAPVILANRHIVFPDYSRYTLPASVGAVIIVAGIIDRLTSRPLRLTLVAFFVAVSVLTHYANAVHAVHETDVIRNYWWQVAWRAPDLQAGATLVASYPDVGIAEDYFVWGPANLIYYPEKQAQSPIEIKLPAAVLTNDVVLKIITGKGVETPERRGNLLTRGFDDILFMVQSSPDSCVRIIDGSAPELSTHDSYRTMVVAPYSKLENVLLDSAFHQPPQSVFGAEPSHEWCYYYQQAALARQQGDWEAVQTLHQQALELGLYPNDSVEWMPFVQAYTVLGNLDELRTLRKIIIADPYLALQTCRILTDMSASYEIEPEVQTFLQNSFCE
ncbi:MAG: hypothetical protein WBL25_09430 [Anaerolineales bacterium]